MEALLSILVIVRALLCGLSPTPVGIASELPNNEEAIQVFHLSPSSTDDVTHKLVDPRDAIWTIAPWDFYEAVGIASELPNSEKTIQVSHPFLSSTDDVTRELEVP